MLQGAAYMADTKDFDVANCALTPLQLDVWRGNIFINFDPEAEPLANAMAVLDEEFALLGWEKCRLGNKLEIDLACNWKFNHENMMDFYADRMTGIDLSNAVAALLRDGSSEIVPSTGGPVRVDGFTVGVATIRQNPPHRGEMHPDGDEFLYLVSGRLDVIVEDGGTQETVGAERREPLHPGQAFLVPKGVWHRVDVLEPSRLVHVTPGPGDGHRPL